ncbi:MAG: methyl-accepting chemotaxis protein [Neptuniibacter sp.]
MKKLTTMSISLRITLGYLVMMLLLAMSGFSSVFNISKLASSLEFVSGPALQASNGGIDTAFNIQGEVLKTQQIFLKQLDHQQGLKEIHELHKKGEAGFEKVKASGLVDEALLTKSEDQIQTYTSLRDKTLTLYSEVEIEKRNLAVLTDQVLESVIVAHEDTMIFMDESLNDRRAVEKYRDIEQVLSEIKTLILSRNYSLQQFFNGDDIDKHLKIMKEEYSLLFPSYERSLIMLRNQDMGQYADDLEKNLGALFPLFDRVVELHIEFTRSQQTSFKTAQELLANLTLVKAQGEDKIKENTDSVVSLVVNAKGLIWAVVIIGLIVGVIAMFISFRTVVKPVDTIAGNLDQIGNGDGSLNVKLKESGARELSILSKGFNVFVVRIKNIVSGVSDAVNDLCQQTDNLATISDNTRSVISEQKQNTEQMVEAIDRLTVSTSEIAESAANAATAARSADEFSENGKDEVHAMINAIRKQVEQLNITSGVMEKLSKDSQRIGEVLSVIDDIAEQTNLLALNAAIEAARAGEKGRGFAVVADEVRTLASNTQQATTKIQDVISELQSASKDAVKTVANTLDIAEKGVSQAERADEILKQITNSIRTINEVNMQVAEATHQQVTITQTIKENIYSVSEKANETSNSFDDINSSVETIISVVDGLEGGVNQFKLT